MTPDRRFHARPGSSLQPWPPPRDQAHQGDEADDAGQRRAPDARRALRPSGRPRARTCPARRTRSGWPGRPRSAAHARGQDETRVHELVPIRYGGCSSRPSRSTAARPRSWRPTSPRPELGHAGPGLRRRAHLELRRLRGSGPQADLRPQRLRRDAARARGSGTSSGWPPASRSPAATSGCRPTGGARIVTDCVRRVPRGDARLRRTRAISTSGTTRLNASELVDRFGGRLGAKGRIVFAKPFAKARRKTSLRAVKKLTERVDGELRFRSVPPLLVPFARAVRSRPAARDETACVAGAAGPSTRPASTADRRYLFETYRFVDMARKVVGVGSVGTRAWVFLLVGRDGSDPLVLQAKEAQPSVLEPYLGASGSPTTASASSAGQRLSAGGQRHVPRLAAQRRASTGDEHDFYVRQLWDWKALGRPRRRSAESGLHAYTRGLRLVARARARALGRPAGDRGLPGRRRALRQGDRRASPSGVRRPERARLRRSRRPPTTAGSPVETGV